MKWVLGNLVLSPGSRYKNIYIFILYIQKYIFKIIKYLPSPATLQLNAELKGFRNTLFLNPVKLKRLNLNEIKYFFIK